MIEVLYMWLHDSALVTFHIHKVYNRVDSIDECTFNQLVWINIHFSHLS